MASSKFEARIKAVQSGDTILYADPVADSPDSSNVMRLAFAQAPLKPRDGASGRDQALSFECREFLRKTLVGRGAELQILYSYKNIDHGIVWLPDGTNVVELAIANGWAEIRNDAVRNESAQFEDIVERLQKAQLYASDKKLGLNSDDIAPIEVHQKLDNPDAFLQQNRNLPLEAIVERVFSGDRLIVRFILDSEHILSSCMVAGVRCPVLGKTDPETGSQKPDDPFAREAFNFTEDAILQRTVTITPVSVSPYGVIIGIITHSTQGDLSHHLLSAGLARVNDSDSTSLGVKAMINLRNIERRARESRVGLFSTGAHPVQKTKKQPTIEAVVYQIVTADTIVLRIKDQKRKVSLSSVRQPIPSDPKQSPWSLAAKERLRSLTIGKKVHFSIDGTRPGSDGYEDREVATVIIGKENLALRMAQEGYVSVVRHRQDDTDRSPFYDELLQAQETAKSEENGIWSSDVPPAQKLINYSESATVANRHINRLSHSKRLRGIVDFVINGSRFVIHMKDGDATTSLVLLLSGIQTPRTGNLKTGEPGEPYSEEAREIANRRCLQRDVTFTVNAVDKNGAFIGSLYINNDNFGKTIVEQGLAKVHEYSANKAGQAEELMAAQTKAQNARVCLWKNYDPEREAADAEAKAQAETPVRTETKSTDTGPAPRPTVYKNITITSIDPENLNIKFQTIGPDSATLQKLMSTYSNYYDNSKSRLSGNPKTGEYVSAKFSCDGRWYRARVQRVDQEKKRAVVCYIDYGNTESLPWTDLRPLADEHSVSKFPGQARDAVLAFVGYPPEIKDTFEWLCEVVLGQDCKAIIEQETVTTGRNGGKVFHITLLPTPESSVTTLKESINAELLKIGLAVCKSDRRMARWEANQAPVVQMFRRLQEEARKERQGCWEYGDIDVEDD